MIAFFSGTPGSGKSLQMAHEVVDWIKKYNKNVLANTVIDRDYILYGKNKDKKNKKKKVGGRFFYIDNEKLTPDFLYKYALKYNEMGVEHQCLLVIDEAQVKFSPTAIKLKNQEDQHYRQNWLEFFTHHRHLGYDILVISQFDRLIDAQIRCCFEYNYVHRKANNFGVIGMLLTIMRIPLFVQVQYWYGNKHICGRKFFTYSKKFSKIYNSYIYREQIISKLTAKYGEDMMQQLMGFKRPISNNTKEKKVKYDDTVVNSQFDNKEVV